MTPERLQKIESVFHAASELEGAERAAFLDQSCGDDLSLRQEIESLLASMEKPAGLMDEQLAGEVFGILAAGREESLTGLTVGHYKIISLLGEGGMGEVYLALDESLGRNVALKMLPAHFVQDADRLRRFKQEARAASALNHPNILTVYEIGEDGGRHFIAAEFIDGQTLRQRMVRAPIPLGEAIDIAAQVASALSEAHAAGVVHRDIKPENIMVRSNGLVKVLDFGLAKLTESPSKPRTIDSQVRPTANVKTGPGMVIGTAGYMSPEQARGAAVDTRTDVWSFGVVLYEMIAGRLPFEGETDADIIASVLQKEPPPIVQYAPHAPVKLRRVVMKALVKDRDGRHQTVDEILFELNGLRREPEISSEAVGRGDAVSSRRAAAKTAHDGLNTAEVGTTRLTSSAALLSNIGRHKAWVFGSAAALLTAASLLAYLFLFKESNPRVNSIAVLPLASSNADPNTEYLADGMTESIIYNLSKASRLRVISRGSAFHYKGRDTDAQAAGRELGVQAVLTGKVTERGDGISVSVELVNVQDNTVLWGEQYNRPLTDVILIQEDISQEISERLRLNLTPEERRQLAKRYTGNAEAYQLYLKGRYYWNMRTEEGFNRAIDFFNQAADADPNFALAYAGLADCYLLLAVYGMRPPKEVNPLAKKEAMRALEIDESLANAHTALASIRWGYERDWVAAEKEYKRAIELNPSYATAHQWYGLFLATRGRQGEAIAELKRAQDLDPLSLSIRMNVGWALYFARQYDQAIQQYQATLRINPNFGPAQWRLALAYEQKGMGDEALSEFGMASKISPDDSHVVALLGHAYAMSGMRGEALKILEELRERSKQKYVSSYSIATVYVGLGDNERALEWLERAYEDRDEWVTYLQVEPIFDSLRPDPRFANLLRRIGLAT